MNQETLKRAIADFLETQTLGVLGTIDPEGKPFGSVVGYTFSPDLTRVFFATSRMTRKYRNLQQHPDVMMVVHSATNQALDFQQATALTIQGRVCSLEEAHQPDLHRHYLERHPYLADFLAAPSTVLIGIQVVSYSLVQRFQNVYLLEMTP